MAQSRDREGGDPGLNCGLGSAPSRSRLCAGTIMRLTYLALVGAILFPCLAQQPPPQKKAAEQPAKPAVPTPPAAPKDIRQQSYVYDLNGRPVTSPGADE